MKKQEATAAKPGPLAALEARGAPDHAIKVGDEDWDVLPPRTSTRPPDLAAEYNWCEDCHGAYQGDQCPGCYSEDEAEVRVHCQAPLETAAGPCIAPTVGEPIPEVSPIVRETVITATSESLKCILTTDEIRNYGVLCARANAEIQAAEDDLQAVKSQFKSRIDKAVATRNEAAQKVNNGYEFRPVSCEIHKDYNTNHIWLMRLDTLSVEWERPMTGDEKQRRLV